MKYVPEENEIVWNMKSFPVSGGDVFSFVLFDISCVYTDSDKSSVQLYFARGTFIVCFLHTVEKAVIQESRLCQTAKVKLYHVTKFSSYCNCCLLFITSTQK